MTRETLRGSRSREGIVSFSDLPRSHPLTLKLHDPAKSHFSVLNFAPRDKGTKTNRGNSFQGNWKHIYLFFIIREMLSVTCLALGRASEIENGMEQTILLPHRIVGASHKVF